MAAAGAEFGARAPIKDRPKYCGVTTNALAHEPTPSASDNTEDSILSLSLFVPPTLASLFRLRCPTSTRHFLHPALCPMSSFCLARHIQSPSVVPRRARLIVTIDVPFCVRITRFLLASFPPLSNRDTSF